MADCEARGCPLKGSCTSGFGWYCQFHLDKHFNDFPKITQKIQNIKHAIDHFFFVKRATPHDYFSDPDRYFITKYPNLSKKEDEDYYQYLDRIWETIDQYVKKGLTKGHVPQEDPLTVDDYMASFKHMKENV